MSCGEGVCFLTVPLASMQLGIYINVERRKARAEGAGYMTRDYNLNFQQLRASPPSG